jgi:hypothetical protein
VLSFLWLLTSFLLLSAFPLIHRFHHHLLSLFPRRDVKGRTWRHPTPLTTSLSFFPLHSRLFIICAPSVPSRLPVI